jgi:hypothetical protein
MVSARLGLIVSAALVATTATQAPITSDPLAFLGPASPSASEQARIDRGEALVKNLPASGADVAVLAISRTDASGDRLVAWIRHMERLKAGPHVESIGRFSNPPQIEDLKNLHLDEDDLTDIRRCRSGDCGVRLTETEMAALRDAATKAGGAWRPAVQDAFRRALLTRVETYLPGGLEAVAPYHDQDEPVSPAREFQQILDRSVFLNDVSPSLVTHLREFPRVSDPSIESFLYWSKEDLGRKPIVLISHVHIIRGRASGTPDALILSKQVYASHYMTGALGLTAIARDAGGNRHYLVHLNQSRLDVLGGWLGGIVRSMINSRLRGEAGEVVDAVRKRIESGLP